MNKEYQLRGILFLENQIMWLKNEKLTGGLTTRTEKSGKPVNWSYLFSEQKIFRNLKTTYGPPLNGWKYIMGVPEGKEKTVTSFEEIVAENSPNF